MSDEESNHEIREIVTQNGTIEVTDSAPLSNLTDFLKRLSAVSISFTLRYSREDSVMVCVDVPGERWEIEFFINGDVEVERFTSDGVIQGRDALDDLFSRFSD